MNAQETAKNDFFYRRWFFFISFYLIIDLGRAQFFLPISSLKPGMLTTLLLVYALLSSGKMGEVILHRQMKYVSAFVLLLILYVPFVTNNFCAYQVARIMILVMPVLLSIVIVINSQNRIIGLLKLYAALLVFMAGFSLLHGGRGLGGSISDENDLCLFLVTFLPLVFFLLGQAKSIKGKIILLGVVCLVLLSVVATFSRGGFVGLIAMASVYWWFSKRKFVLLVGIVLLGAIVFIAGGDEYRREMSTVTDIKENTATTRLLSWEAGWRMFLDKPLGVGGGNFQVRFPDYQSDEFRRNMWGRVAHSLWFTLIPETGVVGIYIYFSIIIANLKDLLFMRRVDLCGEIHNAFFHKLSIAFLASFSGFFVSATFISVLYYPVFWHLTALVVASRKVACKCQSVASKPA